jgi:energy-coupling factor transporter ATP-binding protein EcfA2
MAFQKASKKEIFLKIAITGASGSGKTTGALRVARGLVGPTGKIALIDTENRSASLYADRHDFDVQNLEPPYIPRDFAGAIRDAEKAGYDALIVDSYSHVWEAVLSLKDAMDKKGGNGYTNWAEAGKEWKVVMDASLQSKMHIIACLRAKTEYVLEENDKGKKVPRKIGMAPIARDGSEFEFTSVFDLDFSHSASTSKDRTGLFDGRFFELTEDIGQKLRVWLTTGVVDDSVERAELEEQLIEVTPEDKREAVHAWFLKKPSLETIKSQIEKAKQTKGESNV